MTAEILKAESPAIPIQSPTTFIREMHTVFLHISSTFLLPVLCLVHRMDIQTTDTVCHPVPFPTTVLPQKNGNIPGHSSSCPQTAATDPANPSRKKKPLHTKRGKNSPEFPDKKSVLRHRYTRNLCSGQHSRPIPFFRQSNRFTHAIDCPENRHSPPGPTPNVPCATLTTRFSMVRVDKCDMTNGTAPFARQTFRSWKKRKHCLQTRFPTCFLSPYQQRPLPAGPIICKNRFINVIIFPSLEIPA